MNRRNFLNLSVLSPFVASNLFGLDGLVETDDLFVAKEDIFIQKEDWETFLKLRNRLRRLKRYIGFGNFNIVSVNSALFYARNYSQIGKFTQKELILFEELFYEDPAKYGFYGEKTCFNINTKISKKDVKKIPYTGHYLFRGTPLNDYTRLRRDIGKTITLTSGVRGVIKQMSLYLDKIYKTKGNISLASHSIAPPAYTYHSISDFDVGRKGWGYKNFTASFARTEEFRKLRKLNYIDMRYTINNKDGVRYEPWHVKVI